MSRLLVAQRALTVPGWAKDALWRRAQAIPSLDLRFADSKSLVDATTGSNLVTFTRASSGTFVGSDGLLQTATNDTPRFDHNPTTGESLGLLVEEQRANLHIKSEEFGDAAWTATATESSVTTDATTAPNGTSTADLFKCLTTNDIVRRLVTTTAITVANATTYTASIFIKANSWRYVGLALNANSTNFNTSAGSCTFDLELGTFSNVSGLTAQQATQLQNGWWRVSITGTTVTTTATLRISLQDAAEAPNLAAVGVVDAGIHLWGAQLEAGAFPTSYIPTTTTAVTRSADVCSIAGTAFSGFYNQSEGTVFAEARPVQSGTNTFCAINDGTNNEALNIYWNANLVQFQVRDGGTNQAVITTSASTPFRAIGAYKVDDFSTTCNGLATSVDTSGTLPTPTQLRIGNLVDTVHVNGPIRRIAYWRTRLPDSTLQSITG